MSRSVCLPSFGIASLLCITLLLTGVAVAQNYVAPSTPQIGSANTVTANASVPRPKTTPCTVQLFENLDFSDFNPKYFNYMPPADCPGPWAAVVIEADWSVDAGRQLIARPRSGSALGRQQNLRAMSSALGTARTI